MFKLEIETGWAAFRDEDGESLDPNATEVLRILWDVICKLEARHTDGSVMDVNGNKVGRWSYE